MQTFSHQTAGVDVSLLLQSLTVELTPWLFVHAWPLCPPAHIMCGPHLDQTRPPKTPQVAKPNERTCWVM